MFLTREPPREPGAARLTAEHRAEVYVPKITPQLPISGGAGIPALEISNEDWKMGESVCEQEISNETRERIIDVTRNYMSLATLVIFAPSTSKSIGQIEEIKSAAAGLHAAIMKLGNLYARHMIAVHLKRQPVAVTGGKARSKKKAPSYGKVKVSSFGRTCRLKSM